MIRMRPAPLALAFGLAACSGPAPLLGGAVTGQLTRTAFDMHLRIVAGGTTCAARLPPIAAGSGRVQTSSGIARCDDGRSGLASLQGGAGPGPFQGRLTLGDALYRFTVAG